MADISVDREFLLRLVKSYIEIEVECRAHRALVNRASFEKPNQARAYSDFRDAEERQQQASFDGFLHILEDNLAAGDDAAFRATLYGLLPRQ
jgi:hypothetical protein